MAKGGEVIMGHATVAFTDLRGLTGARFPNVSEFEGQQQYQGSQTRSAHCFEGIIGKRSALQGVLEQAAIVAPTDSTVLIHGEPQTACDIPLANLGRALELLAIRSAGERPYGADEIEFLSQVAGQIAIAIDKALTYEEIPEHRNKLAQETLYLKEEIRSEMGFDEIIGSSRALRHVLQMVETVAPSDSTVLLLGETGTGKELIARAIHERSRRKDRK